MDTLKNEQVCDGLTCLSIIANSAFQAEEELVDYTITTICVQRDLR